MFFYWDTGLVVGTKIAMLAALSNIDSTGRTGSMGSPSGVNEYSHTSSRTIFKYSSNPRSIPLNSFWDFIIISTLDPMDLSITANGK